MKCSEIYLTERMRNKVFPLFFAVVAVVVGVIGGGVCGEPRRILVDTDIDTDDLFALLYLLKLNRSEFQLEAVTINTNAWADAGHAVNQVYDILYMMGRDDVEVGVGGEGGIMEDGTILPDVGGYLPLIDQGMTTSGYCRYRHAIPAGPGGRLDTDSNYGIRKSFLPQGHRRYWPLRQPTAQQVMYEKIVGGPISVLLIGSLTNFAIFLMSNPHLKSQIEHVYIMGGGVRSNGGNLFTIYDTNPYAEFNIFGDPFAAYQVIHSGLPVTIVPLDATNTIPIGESFFKAFQQTQSTYEAQYCFQSLRLARDTWSDDKSFYSSYFMWDSFTAGVAASILKKGNENKGGENDFAEMKYINITVVTSNKPYNISDGSNPLFDDDHLISGTCETSSKFNVKRGGVHSGHVQTGFHDPFCITNKEKCKDGYTPESTGSGGVRVLVATKAKPNSNSSSPLDREFFKSFLDVLNSPIGTGRFNLITQFPYYKQVQYKPDLRNKKLGKPVVFDMDMSAGDFLALFYLLKLPLQEINLKAVIVSPTGWANAATIDVVYDLLHMMGRDDIPVGLGSFYAMNQTDPALARIGDCKYIKAIPNGAGGLLDSDTLYGLARDLPKSSRRYSAETSVKYGAPRDTAHPELRQPLALEVWDSVLNTLEPGSKITVLANGPLTNLAAVLKSNKNATSAIQEVYIVGGHISRSMEDTGNVMSSKPNRYSEMNMFLDPYAAKAVLSSDVNVTLIPLGVQNRVASFPQMLMQMGSVKNKTPEAAFALSLLSTLYQLQRTHRRYSHMNIFLGEILGATILSSSQYSSLRPTFSVKPIKVFAEGDESTDGKTYIEKNGGKSVRILDNLERRGVYEVFWNRLNNKKQSAVIGSFLEQTKMWSIPPSPTS